ncbi:MAG: molybdopterin molybdotransferase MoeA [Burkholderiales bacterium]|nr:molybdopterin molybdotransferase MoeA [Burkholderiales bacterium]
MHGFARRAEVAEALLWIDRHAVPLDHEEIPIEDASGRVLAGDIVAPLDVPAFDRSAMDGYAVQGAQTTGASDYNPIAFRVIGASLPGLPFAGAVTAATAVRIMTGAPLPAGADAVVPAEFAREAAGTVDVAAAVSPGKHVGRCGEDIRRGSVPIAAGRRLRAQDLGLVSSLGIPAITVVRRPRARLIVTGDEVVGPGVARRPHQIYDANSAMLRGLLARDGAVLETHFRIGDDPDTIRRALLAPGADIIMVSGGSSVGAEDHAPRLLSEAGELAIHGIAMRPSSPAGMGRVGDALVFLLPGNPVSCLCAYDFFAGRAIRLRGGRKAEWPYATRTAPLARKIASAAGRVDYCRVRFQGAEVEPLALSGASVLSSTVRADGFVVVPGESEGYGAGAEVTVHLYD